MDTKPIPGTIGAIQRSTEEEFQAFRRMLDSLILTPERLSAHLQRLIAETKDAKEPPQ